MAIMPDTEYLLSLTGHGELARDAAAEDREPEGAKPEPTVNARSAEAGRIPLSI